MDLFAPKYYKDFTCIADKCRHSCCIGWEIDIDSASLEKYEKLEGKYAAEVQNSISFENGTPHFELCADDRCPHLDGRGLCRMITNYGKEILCDICREHPRFYNFTNGRAEVGIGASCEAAAKLILSSDEYDNIVKIGEYTDPCEEFSEDSANTEVSEEAFSPLRTREAVFKILKETQTPYSNRLERIYSFCGVSPQALTDEEWRSVIEDFEYLNSDTKELFYSYSSDTARASDKSVMLSRFLAYLIYRHTAEAKNEAELRLSLGFAFFAERLFASLIEQESENSCIELARMISEELEYSEDNVEALKMEFL
jgi:lysine-N-methylase